MSVPRQRATGSLSKSRGAKLGRMRTNSLRSAPREIFANEPRFLGLIRMRIAQLGFCRRIAMALSDSLPLIIVGQFMLLPTVLRQLAVVLTCDKIRDDGGRYHLYASPEVVCWHGQHLQWAGGAIAAVILWGVLLPGIMTRYIWWRRANLFNDVQLRARVGFISDGYEQRWAFWEGVIYVRKLIIILISVWPDLTRQAEMAWYQVIGVAAVLLHYSCKPFDNRSGELLDRIELYGLCLFLLQVTFIQFVLLADPSEQYDLLAVLVSCMLISIASLLFVVRASFARFYAATVLAVFFFALTVTYWFSGGVAKRELTAFSMMAMAIAMNACFVAWLVILISRQIVEAVAETLSRKNGAAKKDVPHPPSNGKVHKEGLSVQSFFSKPAVPKLFAMLWQRIMNAHFDSLGALIWFDTETQELVLGLHPDRFANDKRISSFIRRKLVATGPFLSDEERQFVAMGLRDAFMHLIVECDMNTVHCSLLEFIVRAAFAWHRIQEEVLHKQQSEASSHGGDSPESNALPARTGAVGDASDAAHFVEMLFDQATFDQAIRAADFQAQLDKFTKMSKEEVVRLVDKFLEVHAERPS